jgi:predicted nucleic acid-binding protein
MGTEDKIFLDTDVVLDHLADRQPFSEYAHRLFAMAEQGRVTLYVSSLSFSNLFYILRKVKGGDEALDLLRQFKKLVKVVSVGEGEVAKALDGSFRDFEDALQCFSARTVSEIALVISRNKIDFPKDIIRVESPQEFFTRPGNPA